MAWDSADQSDLDAASSAADSGGWGGAPGPAGEGPGGYGGTGYGGPAGGYGGYGDTGGMSVGSSGYGGASTASAGPVGGMSVGSSGYGGMSTASPAASAAPAGASISAGPMTGPAGPVSGGSIASAVGPSLSAGSSSYGGPSTAYGGGLDAPSSFSPGAAVGGPAMGSYGGGYGGYNPGQSVAAAYGGGSPDASAPGGWGGPVGGAVVGGPAMGGYGPGVGNYGGMGLGPAASPGLPGGSSGYGGPSTANFAGNAMGSAGQFGNAYGLANPSIGIGPDPNNPSVGIGLQPSIGIGVQQPSFSIGSNDYTGATSPLAANYNPGSLIGPLAQNPPQDYGNLGLVQGYSNPAAGAIYGDIPAATPNWASIVDAIRQTPPSQNIETAPGYGNVTDIAKTNPFSPAPLSGVTTNPALGGVTTGRSMLANIASGGPPALGLTNAWAGSPTSSALMGDFEEGIAPDPYGSWSTEPQGPPAPTAGQYLANRQMQLDQQPGLARNPFDVSPSLQSPLPGATASLAAQPPGQSTPANIAVGGPAMAGYNALTAATGGYHPSVMMGQQPDYTSDPVYTEAGVTELANMGVLPEAINYTDAPLTIQPGLSAPNLSTAINARTVHAPPGLTTKNYSDILSSLSPLASRLPAQLVNQQQPGLARNPFDVSPSLQSPLPGATASLSSVAQAAPTPAAPPSSWAATGSINAAQSPGLQGNLAAQVAYGGPSSLQYGGPDVLNAPGTANLQAKRDYATSQLMSRGWTSDQAAGILGGLTGESAGLYSGDLGPKITRGAYTGQRAYGISQLLGPRATEYQSFKNTPAAGYAANPLEGQLNYASEELTNPALATIAGNPTYNFGQNLRANPRGYTPAQIAEGMMTQVERPYSQTQMQTAEAQRNLAQRVAAANQIAASPGATYGAISGPTQVPTSNVPAVTSSQTNVLAVTGTPTSTPSIPSRGDYRSVPGQTLSPVPTGTPMQPAQTTSPQAPVRDPVTGRMVDPQTGQPVDPTTGQPVPDLNRPNPIPSPQQLQQPSLTNIPAVQPGTGIPTGLLNQPTPTQRISDILSPGFDIQSPIQPPGSVIQQPAAMPGQQVQPATGQPAPEGLLSPTPASTINPMAVPSPAPMQPAQTDPWSQSLSPMGPYKGQFQQPVDPNTGMPISPVTTTMEPMQPVAPITEISPMYRSALESMVRQPAYDPLSSIRAPTAAPPNTLPSGYPPTAPSLPAPQMQTTEPLPPDISHPIQPTTPQPSPSVLPDQMAPEQAPAIAPTPQVTERLTQPSTRQKPLSQSELEQLTQPQPGLSAPAGLLGHRGGGTWPDYLNQIPWSGGASDGGRPGAGRGKPKTAKQRLAEARKRRRRGLSDVAAQQPMGLLA